MNARNKQYRLVHFEIGSICCGQVKISVHLTCAGLHIYANTDDKRKKKSHTYITDVYRRNMSSSTFN